MIVKLTKKELTDIAKQELDADREYKQAQTRARELRPEDPEPPYDLYKDKDPVEVYDEWLKAGSVEWRKAFQEELALNAARSGKNAPSSRAIIKADEKLLKRITKSPAATVKELKAQTDMYLQAGLMFTEDSAGKKKLATKNMKWELLQLFYKPLETLDDNKKKEVTDYIDEGLKKLKSNLLGRKPKYITQYGFSAPVRDKGTVKDPATGKETPLSYLILYYVPFEEHETTEENHIAIRPQNYVTTVDRSTRKIFSNEVSINSNNKDEDGLIAVPLDGVDGKVQVGVAIDYADLIGSAKLYEIPDLTLKDRCIFNAICTHICAGNRVMSYDMIYRAYTGKVTGKVTPSDRDKADIDAALNKFRALFKLEYEYVNEDGVQMIKVYDEPFLTFRYLRDCEKINGKIVSGGIALSDDVKLDPPLLRWARFNRNEIDTRDITLLDVPGLYNGDESFTIKMSLYYRIIAMRNEWERNYHSKREMAEKKRTIRYDGIYNLISVEEPNVDKKKDIKSKIDKCLLYWASKGLISGRQHKRDKTAGNAYYAVVVSFMPKEEK